MNQKRPLVVDMDGSLLRTDSLHESAAASLRHPRRILTAVRALLSGGKAAMKRALATPDVDLSAAPLRPAVQQLISQRHAQGALIVLATGADAALAHQVAARVPIDEVVASNGKVNMTGTAKATALVERFGEKSFDYIGDSRADLAVWSHAHSTYLATSRARGLPAWARNLTYTGVLRDDAPPRLRTWMRALRVHQSAKNILIFLPLIAAHEFTDTRAILSALGAFVAFSLMAFSVYLVNDTLDLSADRAHPTKRRRPLAAGWISPLAALSVSALLAVAALVMAMALGAPFLIVLVIYFVTTTAYSFRLKRIAVVDIVVLALLYMIRIVAGAVVTEIPLSFWFTAVTLFLFLSLALVKRYAEAHESRAGNGKIVGRGYSGDDVNAILALGSATGVGAVLLSAVYIQSDTVASIYPAPSALWLIIPIAFYWIANLWMKAGRGLMHDDPLVFAFKDRASLIAAVLLVLTFLAASLPAVGGLLPGGMLR